jgi:hypothetical protein
MHYNVIEINNHCIDDQNRWWNLKVWDMTEEEKNKLSAFVHDMFLVTKNIFKE